MERVGGMAAAVVAGFMLTGCGSSEEPSQTVASTTSTTSETSPKPWASVVSEQDADLTTLVDEIEKDCVSPTLDLTAVTCVMKIETAKLKGQSLRKKFDELGTAPSEVETLASETLTAADNLGAIEVSAGCSVDTITADSFFLECAGERMNAKRLGKKLLDKYAGWDPYGA